MSKVMISLSEEAMAMLREMRKAPPFYDRVGGQSIVAEQAIRNLHEEWKRRNGPVIGPRKGGKRRA